MSTEEGDRSQEATPHKLSQARKRGQSARSADLGSVVVMAALLAYIAWRGMDDLQAQFRFDQSLLHLAGRLDSSPATLWRLLDQGIRHLLDLLAPLCGALMLSAVAATTLQTGFMFSTHPLGPEWARLNPAAGLKRLFTVRTLFDALRACLKLALLSWAMYGALKSVAPQFFGLGRHGAHAYLQALIGDIVAMGTSLLLAMAFIAVVDKLYVRREFARKMRMSHRELRDEFKNREGDPRIRARLRELRAEALKRSMAVQRTRQADVLVTNPVHLAVALRYEHGRMESPQMLAKGAGAVADAMRHVAASHHIPVVRNRKLARKLFKQLDFDEFVPPALYAEVARIIVWVFAMRRARQAGMREAGA